MKKNTNKLTNWMKLIIGFAALGLFCFVLLPLLKAVPGIKEMTDSNREKAIDAGTLFYTETSQFSEADNFFSNSNESKMSDSSMRIVK